MTTDNFTIGFIGLGLIGGSIAKTIRRIHPNYVLIGFDTNKETLQTALEEHTLDQIAETVGDSFANCNYIFLCAPVTYNLEYLKLLKPYLSENCILTDVGSVKGPIHRAIAQYEMEDYFIGGHPMVGSEKAGYSACTDRLIENAYYFVTPTPHIKEERITEFIQFIEELGAMTILLTPEKHDEFTAAISHVPHIVAAELVRLVKDTDTEEGILKQLAAGGFKDITRIASSSPTVWEQICFSNCENIKLLLRHMIQNLENILEALETEKHGSIYHLFEESSTYRNSVPDNAVGLIQKTYEIFVDIPDEPGTLASTTTSLALHNINIKNIGIIHNREYEEGVLKIVLYDGESARQAYKVLTNRNYTVHIRN